MSGTRLPASLFLGMVLVAVARAMRAFAVLPDRVASSFGASGVAHAWMGKEEFFALQAALLVLAAVIGFLIPRVISRSASALINIPNKRHWLAPERREQTMAILAESMAWYACGLLLFELLITELVIQANLGGEARLANGPFAVLLVSFLIFTFSWVGRMILRFLKPS